ncbi:MAG: creatininase family protein [Candidatus Poribacteria bacterium]|nr:creatininase family protein [Candidatus Poribacteria bacterium]
MTAPHLSLDVQLQFLHPKEFEARAKAFPVVYVPFGPIEWHGKHLPVGVDALKAHAILCQTAETHGGIVYPPTYLHDGWNSDENRDATTMTLTALFQRLKATGFRVIVAISGHDVKGMTRMLGAALEPVVADGTVKALAGWENAGSEQGENAVGVDHAAMWETSYMMELYPDLVRMERLGTAPLTREDGIGGQDPRVFASVEIGRNAVKQSADGIGRIARELLESLPEAHRAFGKDALVPSAWDII